MPLRVDRSRIETRLHCVQKRYWQYDHLGTGITLEGPTPHADMGTMLHAGLEVLLRSQGDVEEAVSGLDHTDQDVWYIVEGMIRGWHAMRYPRIIEEYDIVSLEQEHVVLLSQRWVGLEQMLRKDALLRRKADQQLVVMDYKSLSYYTESWDVLMENSLQTLLYVKAAEVLSNERVAGVQYEGMIKGRLVEGEWESPYVWLYTNGEEFQSKYTARKGWRKAKVREFFTPKEWHEHLKGLGTLERLFQTVPPRRPLDHVVEEIVAQTEREEYMYAAALAAPSVKRAFLTKNVTHCFKYGTRYPCQFYGLCFGSENVMDSNEVPPGYVARVPHHPETQDEN